MPKLSLLFATLALAAAYAASNDYKVTLTSPTWVGPTQLSAGEYRIQVEGDRAVIKSRNRQVAEAPARIETNSQKYGLTSLSIVTEDNKPMLKEVRVGGTPTRIVIGESGQ
jgi:hypothetical protein